ncbi:MAG: pilus assembly protein PilP [Nitrospirota bacterium]
MRYLLSFVLLLTLFYSGCGTKTPETKEVVKKPEIQKMEKATVTPIPEQISPPVEAKKYTYTDGGKRDPFVSLVRPEEKKKAVISADLPPLQRVDISELRLIGIVWEGSNYVAMVSTPDGRGYAVRKGTIIGLNKGVVVDIASDHIVIEEKAKDYLGEVKTKRTVLELRRREEA